MKPLLAFLLPVTALAAYYPRDKYESGEVHNRIIRMKHKTWAREKSAGMFDQRHYPSWRYWKGRGSTARKDKAQCKDGLAVVEPGNVNQTFRCNNMDLYDFMSHADLGSVEGEGSSSWSWTSEDGREFGAIGQADGTAFVEISKTGKIQYLGRLPQQSVPSIWREIRVYNDLAIIGSEAEGHGVQVFDMKKLLSVNPARPVTFSMETDLEGVFTGLPIGRTHNVGINWDLGYVTAVGAQPRNSTCRSGIIYIDISDPTNPSTPGCAAQDGYVHDIQCWKYNGPDTKYIGRDLCFGFNEDTVTLYDSTSKTGLNASNIISKIGYEGATYTHQGWFIDNDWHQYLLVDDELDELEKVGPGASGRPVTHIIDMIDLENPQPAGWFYATDVNAIDRNQYVVDGSTYQSNYGAGLWVHDVSSIADDPTGSSVQNVAFFNIYPKDDALEGGGMVEFVGTWSHFLFPSGYIMVNTIERGAFVVKIAKGKGSGSGPGFPVKSSST